jgi:transcriptional antiterminator
VHTELSQCCLRELELERYVDMRELAELMGVSTRTIKRMVWGIASSV